MIFAGRLADHMLFQARQGAEGIDMTIKAGERWAVCGPTGAGKSLLLRCLAKLDASAGDLLWDGCPVTPEDVPNYRSRVLYLAQNAAVIDGTVEDNLKLALTLHQHRNIVWPESQILEWMARFGKDSSFLKCDSHDLSGGERQIVALLRALVIDPGILLLDEATSALDSKSVEVYETIVGEWFDSDSHERSLVWVTHAKEQVQRVSERVFALENGRTGEWKP